MIFKNSNNFNIQESHVLSLLEQLDKYFYPPLSKRVNLNTYANKLISKGTIDLAYSTKDKAVGLLGYYCNDTESAAAYISVLGVVPKYQGKGIATTLLQMCIANCKTKNMKSIIVKTENINKKALILYTKHGFNPIPSDALVDRNKIKLIKTLN